MVVRGPIGEEGWAMLAEALRLLPPLVPPEADQLFDLNNQGFHSFLIFFSQKSDPRDLMRGGRRQDVKAVCDALPGGSFWHVIQSPNNEKYFYRGLEQDWKKLEHYIDTEEPRPALQAILIDQIMAWYDATGQMFYDLNIPKRIRRDIFGGRALRMEDIFLT